MKLSKLFLSFAVLGLSFGQFAANAQDNKPVKVAFLTNNASDFWTIALRAVFAGWLIALMVWMMPDAASSRVFIILICTYVISICSFSHIIAGSTNVFYLVVLGKLSLAR